MGLGLNGCQSAPTREAKDSLDVYEFHDVPSLEHTDLKLGGFSGLVFEGFSRWSGKYSFTTFTDRGPNLDVLKDVGEMNLRPFVDPQFTPRWVTFTFDPSAKDRAQVLKITGQKLMTRFDGTPMTGLPNIMGLDEVPVDLQGHRSSYDKLGVDTEGMVKDEDGSYWMCEEYRPSLLHFDANAHLLQRWIPKDTATGTGVPQLPKWYVRRQMNRGFEGIAIDGEKVVGFLQSPLKDDFDVTRVLEVDKKTGQPMAEFAYPFEYAADYASEGRKPIDKIGDAIRISPDHFLVVEQNSGDDETAFHRIYEIRTSDATNLLSRNGAELSRASLCSEGTPPSSGALSCVSPVGKRLVADLVALGLRGYDKIEGLVVIDSTTLALVNDNDFDADKTGKRSAFFIVHLAEPLSLR